MLFDGDRGLLRDFAVAGGAATARCELVCNSFKRLAKSLIFPTNQSIWIGQLQNKGEGK
jgi:hypothetical protein